MSHGFMKNTEMKIGIIWADPNSANLGVSALAWSTAWLVFQALSAEGLTAAIHFFCCGKTGAFKLNLPDARISVRAHGYFRRPGWKTIVKTMTVRNPVPRELLGMDVVLDMGEGDSFSDIYGDDRFASLCETKEFLSSVGKKQVLLPQTIGPFQRKSNCDRAVRALRGMADIYARDSMSHQYVEQLLGNSVCNEAVDVAFALPWIPAPKPTSVEHLSVGLNVSGLLWNRGYSGANELGLKAEYKTLVLRMVRELLQNEEIRVVLVPHVFGERCLPVEDDRRASLSLISEVGSRRVQMAPPFENPCEAKTFISTLDIFFGARMHACIAAFSSGVPVLPMAYSRKFNGLFQGTLGYPFLMDLKEVDVEEAVTMVRNAIVQKDLLRDHTHTSMQSIASPRIERFKDGLRKAIRDAQR